eukprot:3019636-Rhodomonas_salina.4
MEARASWEEPWPPALPSLTFTCVSTSSGRTGGEVQVLCLARAVEAQDAEAQAAAEQAQEQEQAQAQERRREG